MATRTTSVRLSESRLDQLDRLARSLDRSRSWVIEQAVERYLDYEEWFAEAVREGIAAADRGELVPHDQVMKEVRARIAKARKRRR
jgi:predicted transcriptional regulator